MKKRTYEILLCIGILLLVLAFITSLFFEQRICCGIINLYIFTSLFIIFRTLSLMGIILIIIALVNWNFKKRAKK